MDLDEPAADEKKKDAAFEQLIDQVESTWAARLAQPNSPVAGQRNFGSVLRALAKVLSSAPAATRSAWRDRTTLALRNALELPFANGDKFWETLKGVMSLHDALTVQQQRAIMAIFNGFVAG